MINNHHEKNTNNNKMSSNQQELVNVQWAIVYFLVTVHRLLLVYSMSE